MPRPGFVLEVDRSTPPLLFHHGEGFRLHKLALSHGPDCGQTAKIRHATTQELIPAT